MVRTPLFPAQRADWVKDSKVQAVTTRASLVPASVAAAVPVDSEATRVRDRPSHGEMGLIYLVNSGIFLTMEVRDGKGRDCVDLCRILVLIDQGG